MDPQSKLYRGIWFFYRHYLFVTFYWYKKIVLGNKLGGNLRFYYRFSVNTAAKAANKYHGIRWLESSTWVVLESWVKNVEPVSINFIQTPYIVYYICQVAIFTTAVSTSVNIFFESVAYAHISGLYFEHSITKNSTTQPYMANCIIFITWKDHEHKWKVTCSCFLDIKQSKLQRNKAMISMPGGKLCLL